MSKQMVYTPKFNIASEKWWWEDSLPIGKVTFQERTVKLREGILPKFNSKFASEKWTAFEPKNHLSNWNPENHLNQTFMSLGILKRKGSFFNHQISGAFAASFRVVANDSQQKSWKKIWKKGSLTHQAIWWYHTASNQNVEKTNY